MRRQTVFAEIPAVAGRARASLTRGAPAGTRDHQSTACVDDVAVERDAGPRRRGQLAARRREREPRTGLARARVVRRRVAVGRTHEAATGGLRVEGARWTERSRDDEHRRQRNAAHRNSECHRCRQREVGGDGIEPVAEVPRRRKGRGCRWHGCQLKGAGGEVHPWVAERVARRDGELGRNARVCCVRDSNARELVGERAGANDKRHNIRAL
eukprot:Amastigsp_a175336_22.p2 type:complete len:212 gc:universal Amastigsp_a175336_22:2252-1617(-)